MFIVGVDCIGGQVFDSKMGTEVADKIELSNGMYDEWKVDNAILDYHLGKKDWGYDTIMLASFNNTLEAGNMSNNGYDIEQLHFKKRNKENLAWTTFAKMNYDPKQKYYQVLDRLAQSGYEYEYAVVPVAGGIEGSENIQSVFCEYDNVWIVDNDNSVRLIYDVEYGEISTIDNTAIITTLEHRYPFTFSTPLSYQQGSMRAKLISETSAWNSKVDYKSQKQLRENIMKFINNKKAKMLKDGLGRSYLVMINGVREIPHNQFNGGLVDVEFSWTEIGDVDNTSDLERVGLLEKNY